MGGAWDGNLQNWTTPIMNPNYQNVKHHTTRQIHHTAQGNVKVTSHGATIPNLLPQEWQQVYANMQQLKLIGRCCCPACRNWFAGPTHFGIHKHKDSDDIYTYATCPACTAKGLATDAARAALLDQVAAFFDGGAK